MRNPEKIRILVVDDHPGMIRGLRACLLEEERLQIVGEARDGVEAITKTQELAPDIVLMDLTLPMLPGTSALAEIRTKCPNVRALVYTVHHGEAMIQRAFQCGASGYVVKTSPLEILVEGIDTVMRGESFLDPNLSANGAEQPLLPNMTVAGQGPLEDCNVIAEAERFIRANLSPMLTVKEVAAAAGKNAADLSRLFWRAKGMTAKEYIDWLCKEELRRRLKDSDCKGSQLAFELGFRDDQSFYRWFQRVFGRHFREVREICTANQTKPNHTHRTTKPHHKTDQPPVVVPMQS